MPGAQKLGVCAFPKSRPFVTFNVVVTNSAEKQTFNINHGDHYWHWLAIKRTPYDEIMMITLANVFLPINMLFVSSISSLPRIAISTMITFPYHFLESLNHFPKCSTNVVPLNGISDYFGERQKLVFKYQSCLQSPKCSFDIIISRLII